VFTEFKGNKLNKFILPKHLSKLIIMNIINFEAVISDISFIYKITKSSISHRILANTSSCRDKKNPTHKFIEWRPKSKMPYWSHYGGGWGRHYYYGANSAGRSICGCLCIWLFASIVLIIVGASYLGSAADHTRENQVVTFNTAVDVTRTYRKFLNLSRIGKIIGGTNFRGAPLLRFLWIMLPLPL
jgi:hypothetical protein